MASATVRANRPTESICLLSGMTPLLDVKPIVGLMPTTPFIEAGPMIDPSVSVPKESGTMLAATATAEPELDPTQGALVVSLPPAGGCDLQGLLDRSYGFRV